MNKHVLSTSLVIGITFFFLNFLFAQNIDISYINPDFIEVCDKEKFEVILVNKSNDNLTNVTVEVSMPEGLTYIPGTINDATEFDISDLSKPVFKIPDFQEDWNFDYEAAANCSLFSDINNGKIFANTITADYTQGRDRIITLPYRIETGFLVITKIEPEPASGQFGDIIRRRITVKNTRVGKISTLNFQDMNDGGLLIATDGTNPMGTPSDYSATFDGSHFQNIGNGDEFLDLNEEIVIIEEITINTCFEILEKTLSNITVSWGCNSDFCQSKTSTALINFEPYTKRAELEFEAEFNADGNFCESDSYTEKLTITNVGDDIAQELRVDIFKNNTVKDTSLITVTSNGTNLPFTISRTVLGIDIDCPPNLFDAFSVNINEIAPNQVIEINWENSFCTIACDEGISPLGFGYRFNNICPGIPVQGSGSEISYQAPSLLKDSISFDIGRPVLNGRQYEFRYDLRSDILNDSAGVVEVQFTMPCGYSWSSTPLILDGKTPLSTDIDASNIDAVIVTLQYELPFSTDHVWGNFYLDFNCLAECNVNNTFLAYNLISTCPEFFLACWFDGVGASLVDIDGQFQAGEAERKFFNSTSKFISNSPDVKCEIVDCEEFDLINICGGDTANIQSHVFEAYLDFDANFRRENIGLKDSNDDRVADNNSTAPLNEVRADRFLTGDIMSTKAAGVVVNDLLPVESENVKFRVCFEQHLVDSGINGTDSITVLDSVEYELFERLKGIKDLDAFIKIVDKDSGAEYQCPLNRIFVVEDSILTLTIINTRPKQVFDKWRLLSYTYQLNLPSASQIPGSTIPAGFKLTEGDSVYFEARHKIVHNPSLVALALRHYTETAIYNGILSVEENFSCGRPFHPFELTGYEILKNVSGIQALPCEEFESRIGTYFNLYIGRDNFFTNEVRPLIQIVDWDLLLPPGYKLIGPTFINMGMNNFPATVQNQPIVPNQVGDLYKFDVLQFQDPLYDEGFYMNFNLRFEPLPIACSYTQRSKLKLISTLNYLHDFCRFQPTETDSTIVRAFVPQIPFLNLSAENPNHISTDESAAWDLILENLGKEGRNVWMTIESKSNKIFDIVLKNKDTNQEITPNNGIYQLGDYDANDLSNFELLANFDFCGTDSLDIYFGWNCDPIESLDEFSCNRDSFQVFVSAPETDLPQLEIIIDSPIDSIELCDTIPYHTVEIYNADFGIAYNMDFSVLMPTGMTILPGTSQISYSTASNNFINIPDPTDLGNGNYVWKINDIQSFIRDNGLLGISNDPQNSFSIRFLGFANCNLIASASPIISTSGFNFCEEPTNTLSKPGKAINVMGVRPDYGSIITLDQDAEVSCGNELEMFVNIQVLGTTTDGDSIIITLPEGVSYVSSSYQPSTNATSVSPSINQRGNLSILSWPINVGVARNESIKFSFKTIGYGNERCEDELIQIQTIQAKEAFCKTLNDDCGVFVQTGNNLINVEVNYPEWSLTSFNGVLGTNGIDYSISGNNAGNMSQGSFTIDFYLDVDGNGFVSAGDTKIGDQTVNSTDIQNNDFSITGNLNASENDICNIIAIISLTSNCICTESQINLMNQSLSVQNYQTCSGEAIDIGVSGITGADYFWDNPANISCTDCPNAEFISYNLTNDAQTFNYVLTEDNSNCPKQILIEVEVFPVPEIITDDQEICEGISIQLMTTPAPSVNWTGQGINNPTTPNPIVTPSQSTTYYADFSTGNCANKDSVTIEVIPGPMIDAGRDTAYCDAVPGLELSTIFNSNYTYFWEPSGLLSNFQSHNPTITSLVSSDFILTVRDQTTDCSLRDTVSIQFGTTPQLTTSDDMTICGGDTVQLVVNGADNYTWSNGGSLSCDDCQAANAFPTTTTTYVIEGTDAGICKSTDSITVFVNGQNEFIDDIHVVCGEDSIEIDGVVYTQDTLSVTFGQTQEGCDSIHTFQVSFFAQPTIEYDSTSTGIEIDDPVTIEMKDGFFEYKWEPSPDITCDTCQVNTVTPQETTVYIGYGYNENGCLVYVRTIRVEVFNKCSAENITMPNIFSPNGDSRNEIFKPIGVGVEEIHSFKIFNRWGQKIYDGNGPNACWDGYYKGEPQPVGVYVYILELGCSEDREQPLTGDITLLR